MQKLAVYTFQPEQQVLWVSLGDRRQTFRFIQVLCGVSLVGVFVVLNNVVTGVAQLLSCDVDCGISWFGANMLFS